MAERATTPHTTLRLDGKEIAAPLRQQTADAVSALRKRGIVPGLAVVRVGDDPASQIYVKAKLKAAAALGIVALEHHLPAADTQGAVESLVAALAGDDAIDGILIQLPLPKHLDVEGVLAQVPSSKDVDGFGLHSLGALTAGAAGLRPCTPAGVMRILEHWAEARNERLAGKRALVIGRSRIVGKPVALLLLAADCTVTIAHSRTVDLAARVAEADIVIAAAGAPRLIQGSWLRNGAVVVDVGIHRLEDGSLCGDVDTEGALGIADAITPVPGGVGPLTIAQLMANTGAACKARRA